MLNFLLHGNWGIFWSGFGNDIPLAIVTGVPTVWLFLRKMEKHHQEHMALLKKHHAEVMGNGKGE